jgi:hypothetical protein
MGSANSPEAKGKRKGVGRIGRRKDIKGQNISKNTAMELSSRPCGSGGNSYVSSREGREREVEGSTHP